MLPQDESGEEVKLVGFSTGRLSVVMSYIENLYCIFVSEDENCSVPPVDPEAEEPEMFRFQQLYMQTWMVEVFLQEAYLLGAFRLQLSLS